jgi:hypothetical protein
MLPLEPISVSSLLCSVAADCHAAPPSRVASGSIDEEKRAGQSDMPDRDKFTYTFDKIAQIIDRFTEMAGLDRFAIITVRSRGARCSSLPPWRSRTRR